VNANTENPFDSIDVAQEYLALLEETVAENRNRVDAGMCEASIQGSRRYVEALRVVSYNLESLENHLRASRRKLNNLHKLRRLIIKKGAVKAEKSDAAPDIKVVVVDD